MKQWLVGLVLLLITLNAILTSQVQNPSEVSFQPKPLPLVNQFVSPPKLVAQSAVVFDVDSGTVLFQKNFHLELHPASITKMATAIVALETYPLDEVIEVSRAYPVGRNMELQPGERISVKNLIYGLLVHSANDAAFVLAGQEENRIKNFINRMNNFVVQLGLENTHFINFDGEDDQNHYSTAFDLAHLARWALKNKIFVQAVQTREMEVADVQGKIIHYLETTNELLGVAPEVKGIKTGWTPKAGECFVGLIQLKDHQLITVVLKSNDRFGETKKLIQWAKEAVSWQDYSVHSTETAGT